MNRLLVSLFALTITAGCGETGETLETTGFELAPCDLGVSDLSPAQAVDYVGFTELGGYFGPGEQHEGGTACSGATDEDACLAAVEDVPRERLMGNAAADLVLVTTSGDEVTAYITVDEVLTFLGDIDTPGEAVQVARWSGYELGCSDVGSGGVKAVDGGFELIAIEYLQLCEPEKSQQVHLRVDADGSVEVLETVLRKDVSSPCP